MPYANQDFEREKLYEEVWAEPVTTVAKRYQISDVGLRKICISLGVPLPVAGHWAKVAAGKTVKKPPLPPTKGPTTYQRSMFKDPRDDELSTRAQAKINEDAARAPEVPAITVRTTIDECLPLVKRMAKKLDGKQRDSRTWPYCEGAGLMRISVSRQNSLRALLVLNHLLETLSAAGYSVSSGDKESDPAYATIFDVKLTFRVKERSRQESIPLTQEQLAENKRLGWSANRPNSISHPTNEFEISAFELGSSYVLANIADTRSLPIETKIQALVCRLRNLVIRESVRAEMAAEERVIAAAKEAERARLAEIRRVALNHLKRVEDWASKLERANRLRALAVEFESKQLRSSNDVVDATWIRRAADWLDPTVECRWDDVDNAPAQYGELY
ncbi:hypothetical protein BX591_10822 [Paraburkholderia bryophila]|uniref:Uncharacterized protein n=2 Tax=Paraburkholderia bryophila TaxID=420952 RepID=A0A329CCT0_9BURK|nr:hypothetical protein BX591_10822 [Paraburkholderia bryophila]